MCQHELRGLLYFIIFILTSMEYQDGHDPIAFVFGLVFVTISFVETVTYLVKAIRK